MLTVLIDFDKGSENMPPKIKITKEELIRSAVEYVRRYGEEGLNARSLAKEAGCSTQPLFSNFKNMEELRFEVIRKAAECYERFVKDEVEKEKYPPYKAAGMAYIRFAKEERELFRLLFMRDRQFENRHTDDSEIEPVLTVLMKNLGLSRDNAKLFHLEMWICVHGIASMTATDYYDIDEELASLILTDVYTGLVNRFESRCDK